MSVMRIWKFLFLAVVFSSAPIFAQEQTAPASGALGQVISKVSARERQELQMIRQHSPLVETYIQKVRVTENDGSWVPDGDHYFIGPADDSVHHMLASLTHLFDFGTEFLPQGFLQMIYPDGNGLE